MSVYDPLFIFFIIQIILQFILLRLKGESKSHPSSAMSFSTFLIAFLVVFAFYKPDHVLLLAYMASHIIAWPLLQVLPKKISENLALFFIFLLYAPYTFTYVFFAFVLSAISDTLISFGLIKTPPIFLKIIEQAKVSGVALKYISRNSVAGKLNGFEIEVENKNNALQLLILENESKPNKERFDCILNNIKASWKGNVEDLYERDGFMVVHTGMSNLNAALACAKNAIDACPSSKK